MLKRDHRGNLHHIDLRSQPGAGEQTECEAGRGNAGINQAIPVHHEPRGTGERGRGNKITGARPSNTSELRNPNQQDSNYGKVYNLVVREHRHRECSEA